MKKGYEGPTGLINRLQSWDIDIDELLEESKTSERERLARELEEVEKQLDSRDDIHEEIVDELEWKVDWYTDRLESLYKTGRGLKDDERERLQNRIEAFYVYLREEHRGHWRDRQELEQERREIVRELAELEDDTLSELL